MEVSMRTTMIAATLTAAASLTLAAAAAARRPEPLTFSPVPVTEVRTATLDDPTIVAIFDAANTADIETGQLAAERGHSKEARDFGAMLTRDHNAVRQLGRDLAKRLGVTPTPPADDASAKAHADAMATLRGLRGAEFDHAFLQHEAAFHKSVLDAVRTTLLPAIKNEELKALVVKVAPAFEAHMIAAQNLDKQLAAKSSE
jgi:putative membrane protein